MKVKQRFWMVDYWTPRPKDALIRGWVIAFLLVVAWADDQSWPVLAVAILWLAMVTLETWAWRRANRRMADTARRLRERRMSRPGSTDRTFRKTVILSPSFQRGHQWAAAHGYAPGDILIVTPSGAAALRGLEIREDRLVVLPDTPYALENEARARVRP